MKWFDDVQRLAPETALQLMGMGATVTKVLGLKDRLTGAKPKGPGQEGRLKPSGREARHPAPAAPLRKASPTAFKDSGRRKSGARQAALQLDGQVHP